MKLSQNVLDLLEKEGFEIREGYVGRNCFGLSTLGVVARSKEAIIEALLSFLEELTGVAIANSLYVYDEDEDEEGMEAVEENKELIAIIFEDLRAICNASVDNMGKYDIIVY